MKKMPFSTEIELCRSFVEALPGGWIAYPEWDGWDILLVRCADGFQIGIEAKLRLNAEVLNQAIEDGRSYAICNSGPDCRAVLVPSGDAGAFHKIAGHLGITVIRKFPDTEEWRYNKFSPLLPKIKSDYREEWFEQCPTTRHRLPDYVPDVSAGAVAPLQLTDWKIKAMKLAIILERRGNLTRADFKWAGIDHRRWLSQGWLVVSDGRWVAGAMPDFPRQHPRVYGEIASGFDDWAPAANMAGLL